MNAQNAYSSKAAQDERRELVVEAASGLLVLLRAGRPEQRLLVGTGLLGLGLVSAWACMIAHNLLVFALYVIFLLRGRMEALVS